MNKKFKYIFLIIIIITINACSSSTRSELTFNNQIFKFTSKTESSGGQFNILNYVSGDKKIYLVVPHKKTDLDSFAKLYTQTFKAQGFRMTSDSNEHIGVSTSNIVYLTASPGLGAVSILLINKTPDSKSTIEESAELFSGLRYL